MDLPVSRAPTRRFPPSRDGFRGGWASGGEVAVYFRSFTDWPERIDHQEFLALLRKYRNAKKQGKRGAARRDAFLRAIISSHIRFVFFVARAFSGFGVPLLDLVQAGVIGIVTAVRKFDIARGFRFTTYARWWVELEMRRAILEYYPSRPFYLPERVVNDMSRIRRVMRAFHAREGRDPDGEELSALIGMALNAAADGGVFSRTLELVYERTVSLDAPLSRDRGARLVAEAIPDPAAQTDRDLDEKETARIVRELLANLAPRDAEIMRLRFGVGMKEGLTLEDVGRRFGLTRERIRQIEKNSLRRMLEEARRRQL